MKKCWWFYVTSGLCDDKQHGGGGGGGMAAVHSCGQGSAAALHWDRASVQRDKYVTLLCVYF